MSFAYITEEGAYIEKRGGVFVVGRNREVVMEIPIETLDGLVLIGSVQVSSRAIVEFLRLERRPPSVLRLPSCAEEPSPRTRVGSDGGVAGTAHRRDGLVARSAP